MPRAQPSADRTGRGGHRSRLWRTRAGGPHPRHVVAAVVALVVLAGLGITGVVQGLAPAAPLLDAGPSTSAPGGPPATSSTPPSTTSSAASSAASSATSSASSSATTPAPTGPLTLVGLGDSVPSAETCSCTGYVEQVGGQLERLTHRPWTVHNDAVGGWTTADVENDVNSSPTRDHLANADVVLIEVGANDFDLNRIADEGCFPAAGSSCWSATLAGVRDGLTRIIAAIRRIDHRPDLRIGVLGYWNVTRDGAVGRALGQAFVLGSDSLTRLVNDTVQQVALATGASYVDTYTPLKGESGTRDPTADLLDDGDHPNASGHTLLAGAVLDELVTAGAVKGWQAAP